MNKEAYLSDEQVAHFVEWAGHLVRGEWGLEHSYQGKGPAFECSTLYQAYQHYLWPNSRSGESAGDTMDRFDGYRRRFAEIQPIASDADQREFFSIAKEIVEWGGINNLDVSTHRHWGRMSPVELQRYIDTVKRVFDLDSANTDRLGDIKQMSSGFSKIYSALVPGLPIYDSRVACALTCLVRLFSLDTGTNLPGGELVFPVPANRGGQNRCKRPGIYHGQERKYAEANLRTAWLIQRLVDDPGEFAGVPEPRRADSLQSALFMLGYTGLRDDAVVKRG